MNWFKLLFSFLASLPLLPGTSLAHAEAPSPPTYQASSQVPGEPPKTVDVVIFGNHIFDKDTIFAETGLALPTAELTLDEIRNRLLSTGYFSRVAVTQTGHRIRIVVREKQPSFVLPYFSSSSERKMFGIAGGSAGLDEGATEVLARYQVGTGDHEASLLFRKDFLFDGSAMIGGSINYQNALHDDYYLGRDVVDSWGNRETDFTLALGYHLSPSLVARFDTHFEVHRFEGLDGAEVRGDQLSHRLYTEIGSFYVDEGLTRGYRFKPYVEFTNPLSTFSFVQWGAFAAITMYRNGNFNWTAYPRFEGGDGLPRYQLFELGGPKLRGFSAENFRSDHYSELQNDVLLTSYDLGKGLQLRPLVFADWAYVENGGRSGVGAGVNVYFKHVSVPAIQISGGYGFHPNGFSVAAAIGPQI